MEAQEKIRKAEIIFDRLDAQCWHGDRILDTMLFLRMYDLVQTSGDNALKLLQTLHKRVTSRMVVIH